MVWTYEISEDLRKIVVDAHQTGNGYKSISKGFGLHRSTIRQIKGNSRSILPSPRVETNKDHSKNKVCDSPWGLNGSHSGVHGMVARRMPMLSKNNTAACLQFAKDYVDNPKSYWKNFVNGWVQNRTFCFKFWVLCLVKGKYCISA